MKALHPTTLRVANTENPEQPYHVPAESVFEADGGTLEFIPAPDIEQIADALIEADPARFGFLRQLRIVYLWKARGGTPNGKKKLGGCQRPTGLLRYFAGADFVIWLAADNCREPRITVYQLEALIYHELLHAGITDEGKPTVWPHDFQAFNAEVATYGACQADLQQARQSFEQLRLSLN